ncbi:putative RNA helicase SDE3 [Cucurbita argyrosperma subsp. argyrosperma]|nr:putative RNA helicase SDE3 [Cucurbita argyrosperma subsp. argyrosperma]
MSMIINFLRRIFGIDRPENDNRGKARQLRVFASSYTGSKSEFDKGGCSRRFHPSTYQLSQSVKSIKIRPKFGRPLRDLIKKPKSLFESLVTTHTVRPSASTKNSESSSKSAVKTYDTGQSTSIEKLKSTSKVVGQFDSVKKSGSVSVSRASEPPSEFIAKTYATAQSTSIKKSESDKVSRASEPYSEFTAKTYATAQSTSIEKSESVRVSRASEPSSEFIAKTYATAQSTSINKSESIRFSRASEPSSEFIAKTYATAQSTSVSKSESVRVSRASEPSSEFISKIYATAQSTSNKKSVSDSPSRASISSSNFFMTTTTHTTGKSASPKPAVPLPEVTAEPPPTSNPTLRPVSGHGRNQSAYILEANSSLALYLIPKDVEELIKTDAVPPVLRHPVCPATYKSYFAALLYAEDFYCKKWSDYKLESVNLELQEIAIRKQANRKARINGDEKFYKTFAAFEFDSVPERRPFLLSRDLVHARLSGTEYEPFQSQTPGGVPARTLGPLEGGLGDPTSVGEGNETFLIRGFVYRVSSSHRSRKGSVLLVDFGDDFYDWHHETNKYDISFTFNRVCLKRAHQAIQEASDSLFHNFLFPESMSRTRHPTIQVTHSESAVHHILNLHSSPPYLINGPPCIHVNDRARNRTFELSRTGTIVKEAVIQIYSTSPNCRILICAPKNSTCDELMISLKKVIPESNMFRAIAAFRERDDVPSDIMSSCYYNEDEECFSSPILDKLREYKIIFSTYMSSFRLHAKGLAAGHFNHIFLLDASAAIEPETLVPLTKFATNATSVIVTGQTGNQPNYVRSTIGRRNGLKTSYFERLEVSLPYRDLNPLFISGLEEQTGSNGEVFGLTGTYMGRFHTLINGGLFFSPTNVGYHNPPPSASNVLAGTLSFLQSMWDCLKSTPFGASVLTGTPPRVYPLRGIARRLTHHPVFGSDTICNDPDPPLTDIVFFGLPLKALKRVC